MSDTLTTSGIIGSGGFGTVYQATLADGAVVALKVPHKDKESLLVGEVVRQNIDSLSGVTHPGIARPLDLVDFEGRRAVVSQFVPGAIDVAALHGSGTVPHRAALQIVAAAAEAAEAGRVSSGACHGDLKPQNLLLTKDGEVHITDYGLMSSVGLTNVDPNATMLFGSLGYMAPEALDNEPSGAEDVYALSKVLWELVTRARPSKAPIGRGRHDKQVATMTTQIGNMLGEDGKLITALIGEGMSYDPGDRPSAADFAKRAKSLASTQAGLPLRDWAKTAVGSVVEGRGERVVGGEDLSDRSGQAEAVAPSEAKADGLWGTVKGWFG